MNTASSPRLRSVAMPTERGGWSLTLEPVLLGLLVAPSWPGLAIGAAALLAFLARTPVKLTLVDRRRGRSLARTRLAQRAAMVELAALAVLAGSALASAGASFLWPLALAAPLVAIEVWYDSRSRSRRLLPEMAGSVGVASVAAAVALAGGGSGRLAAGLWCVAAARAVAAIAFVRVQLRRSKGHHQTLWHSDGFQLLAAGLAAIGLIADAVSVAGCIAIAVLALIHGVLVRRPVPATPMLGAQQVVLGLAVVLTAGLGALAP